MTLFSRAVTPWRVLIKELSSFGVIGVANFFVDTGLFNLCRHWGIGPITSNVFSTTVATTISYFANRHWSFSHRARTSLRREYSLFFLFNGIALGMSLLCLGFVYYILGMHSSLAENAAKLAGLAAGTVFRFWSYKRWVFLPEPETNQEEELELPKVPEPVGAGSAR